MDWLRKASRLWSSNNEISVGHWSQPTLMPNMRTKAGVWTKGLLMPNMRTKTGVWTKGLSTFRGDCFNGLTFLALAHMVDATQTGLGWGGVKF